MNTQAKKYIAVLFIILLVLPIGFVPQRAHALFGVGDIVIDIVQQLKEFVLDSLVSAIVNAVIDRVTADIVVWITSGFDGNPAFIDDLGGVFDDVTDQVSGEFFDSSGLNWLCSPFQVQVKLALLEDINRDNIRYACTLSAATENVEKYFGGDFSQGGWQTWFELTQRPENSPYGAYIVAQGELSKRVVGESALRSKSLEFGRGFLTKEECAIYDVCTEWSESEGTGPYGSTERTCVERQKITAEEIPEEEKEGAHCFQTRTLTPGSIIEGQLQEVLPSSLRRVEVADEIDEIISATISLIISEIFTQEGGLRAASEYIDELGLTEQVAHDLTCDGGNPGSIPRTISLDRFEILPGSPEKIIDLALDGHYPQFEASFDFFLGENLNPNAPEQQQNIFLIRHGGQNFAGWFIGIHIMDQVLIFQDIGNNPEGEEWNTVTANWEENTQYHFEVVYDATTSHMELTVTDIDNNNENFAHVVGVVQNSLYPSGGGPSIHFGDELKPIIGAIIEDFEMNLTPGAAICGGVPS